ncbi:SAM-dependent methyltransferase N-terminal domain protein [Candidatus Trichorickettsia mobilis]|jgi:ubiquinone/menaquinone biosynthesis C-methylase UbiE|uniref:SAM-dependent methyltransferase N-terminal domain protein n=1 Tax=Candidatus Trichorickettsia mobilis TaxID=1346319 RepID=A0ABZ0UUP7_9RICK|nr:methyltransferase domain-containing protein [Candidatus Trichorickettsia mobilis]WPY00713.1 SAM-dependent methyltransferase N-terminal domain protein [Candidatus Trichorickettsia mobilis]
MKRLTHTTAKASYYNTRAQRYDEFNENNSKAINALLEKILKEHHVSTVLDLTCRTGSQAFWLKEKGFEVVGSDISRSMLKIIKQKAKHFYEKLGFEASHEGMKLYLDKKL